MWNLTSLYKYDNSIFDEIILPVGMDRTLCLNRIMWRCGLEQPIYGEPEVFKSLTGIFFQVHQYEIQKMWDALHQEYNPIENYDRNTSGTRSNKRNYADNKIEARSGDSTITQNDTAEQNMEGISNVTDSGTDSTTNTISAYNSSDYQPDKKSDITYGKKSDTTTSESDTSSYNRNQTEKISDDKTTNNTGNSTDDEGYAEHVHGNIGVTTSQQMIQSEIDLYKNNNIYDWIANKFENEMMITVW